MNETAPKGWEQTVKKMKSHPDISNAYALSNWMADRGYSPHKETGALIRRAKYECAREGASMSALGFLARRGTKEAAAQKCSKCGAPLGNTRHA